MVTMSLRSLESLDVFGHLYMYVLFSFLWERRFGTGEIGMRSGMRGRNGEPASTEDAEGHGQGQPNSQIHAHAHSQAATGSSPIFVSAVSWCPADVPTLFAANSQGTVKMLELA